MQINGVNEFFSKITALTKPAAVQNDPMTPGMSPLQAFLADSFDISKMGERLRFGVDEASLLEESRSGSVDNPILIATEQYLAKVETILTRMHEIASLAADEKLMNLVQDKQVTDLVRVDMQIEMEQLTRVSQLSNRTRDNTSIHMGSTTHGCITT